MNIEGTNGDFSKFISSMTVTFGDKKTDKQVFINVKGCYKDLKEYVEVADKIWESLKVLGDDASEVYRIEWGETGIGPGMSIFIDAKDASVLKFIELGDILGLDVYSMAHEEDGMKVLMFCKNP